MTQTKLQFEIDQLRKDKTILLVESISVFIFSLFMSAFLPQLLFRYFYANQQLLEEPVVLQYIPVAAFVLGVGYFFFAMAANLLKSAKIARLEKELALVLDDCCCQNSDQDLQEMQDIVDELLQEEQEASKKKNNSKAKNKPSKKKTSTTKKKKKASNK